MKTFSITTLILLYMGYIFADESNYHTVSDIILVDGLDTTNVFILATNENGGNWGGCSFANTEPAIYIK